MSFWVRRIAGNFLLIGLLFLLRGEICQASMEEGQSEAEFMQQEMVEDLELSQVERAVDELLEEDVSFRELFQGLVKDGQISFDFSWEKVGLLFLADVLGIQKKPVFIFCCWYWWQRCFQDFPVFWKIGR